MTHAVSDDHVGCLGIEPTIHHSPVDGMHQVGAHQSVHIGELLLEDVSPASPPDRLIDSAQLPCLDGGHIPGHHRQFLFECADLFRGNLWRYPQEQRSVHRAGTTTQGSSPPIRHAVDVGDRRIAQCIVEIASGPGIEVWEPKVDQDVTAVA